MNYMNENENQMVNEISKTPYLVWAIIVTIACSLPLGIAAIVYAVKIGQLQKDGFYEEAKAAARKSRNFSIAAAVVALALLGFAFFLMGANY